MKIESCFRNWTFLKLRNGLQLLSQLNTKTNIFIALERRILRRKKWKIFSVISHIITVRLRKCKPNRWNPRCPRCSLRLVACPPSTPWSTGAGRPGSGAAAAASASRWRTAGRASWSGFHLLVGDGPRTFFSLRQAAKKRFKKIQRYYKQWSMRNIEM